MEEEKTMNEQESYEPERNYLSAQDQSKWKLDWNMLLYQPEVENGFKIDWNKLVYNDDQMSEFNLQKQEKMIQPDKYEYLFENPTERSAMELYYLKMAGYDIAEFDNQDSAQNNDEAIIKRLIINDTLMSC